MESGFFGIFALPAVRCTGLSAGLCLPIARIIVGSHTHHRLRPLNKAARVELQLHMVGQIRHVAMTALGQPLPQLVLACSRHPCGTCHATSGKALGQSGLFD